ncbi:MAG: hypothetical protein Q4G52_03740 [Clostridia bacterium]|nr:hypothetical protein [Clostridia bacterium]
MKHQAVAFLFAAWFLLAGQTALAQQPTYVFPYEGFRYAQQEGETVLTQTNLEEHEDLIEALGTTKEAVLASYIASGIVMEVIPDEGGQIAVSVVSAGAFSDVQNIDELDEERLSAFEAQFASSGLYESCELTQTTPVCVRMTSSAMVASMPVYTLRYATLNLGQLYMLTQTVVGRAPDEEDDARIQRVLSGMKMLKTLSEATPEPTAMPTPAPEVTPEPTPGVAQAVSASGEMTVEGVPAYTSGATLALSGTAAASVPVTVSVNGETIATANAKKDGTFSVTVTLPEEGDLTLCVASDTAERVFAVRYEMAALPLAITEPESPVFTGTSVTVRGVTEPGATVYVEGKGVSTNVKAGQNGAFSTRITMNSAGTETFTFRARLKGYRDTEITYTLTRELTEREGLALFRQKVIEPKYEDLCANPAKYAGKQFISRGKVAEFTDYDGSPCALVLTRNVSTGVWRDPIWIVLGEDMEVAEGDIVTFYLVGEGQTLPAAGEYTASGEEAEAPVARAAYMNDQRQ